jgi:hypothetical protein
MGWFSRLRRRKVDLAEYRVESIVLYNDSGPDFIATKINLDEWDRVVLTLSRDE